MVMVCKLGLWPAHCMLSLFGDLSDLIWFLMLMNHTTLRTAPHRTPTTEKSISFSTVWLVWHGLFFSQPYLSLKLGCLSLPSAPNAWVIPLPMYHVRLTVANAESECLLFLVFYALQ